MSSKKQNLGQFFTTNADYILSGFEDVIKEKNVSDPFAGSGDLLSWAIKNGAKSTKGYDIDEKLTTQYVKSNDSLKSIPSNEFIITNPPYLGTNKMNKKLKETYDFNGIEDFYLLAIQNIIKSKCPEGIIIIPVNFFSAENSNKTRSEFLSTYNITHINYFTEQVFDDTTYNVVAFHFILAPLEKSGIRKLSFNIFPSQKQIELEVESKFDFKIAGKEIAEITNSPKTLKIKRLTEKEMKQNEGNNTIETYYNDFDTFKSYYINNKLKQIINNNITVINCIDGKSSNRKICAESIETYNEIDGYNIDRPCLVGKNTSRNIAYLFIDGADKNTQKILINMFNHKLNELRKSYNSLFLTNFRDNDRKRISFDFCYQLLNYCYNQYFSSKQNNQP